MGWDTPQGEDELRRVLAGRDLGTIVFGIHDGDTSESRATNTSRDATACFADLAEPKAWLMSGCLSRGVCRHLSQPHAVGLRLGHLDEASDAVTFEARRRVLAWRPHDHQQAAPPAPQQRSACHRQAGSRGASGNGFRSASRAGKEPASGSPQAMWERKRFVQMRPCPLSPCRHLRNRTMFIPPILV